MMNRLVNKSLLRTRVSIGRSASGGDDRLLSVSSHVTQEFKSSDDLAMERYNSRANEDINKKRARLLYQSKKRGMLENGVILASFADKFLKDLDPKQLDQYDRLINLPTNDWDIYHWATRAKPTPDEFETPIMQKLRDHMNSKVSKTINDTRTNESINKLLKDKRPYEVVMPAKSKINLEMDFSEVNLTDYDKELFTDQRKTFRGDKYIELMTNWRRKFFVKRIKRTISSPISLRNMSDDQKTQVYTQRVSKTDIASRKLFETEEYVVDSTLENLKHHVFLQKLLSSEFTDDALMYDDEAFAWSEIVWHRHYGSADNKIAISTKQCSQCKKNLHCCDPGLDGYVPKEILLSPGEPGGLVKCQRCYFSDTYQAHLSIDLSHESYIQTIGELKDARPSLVCILVDLTDFPSGIWDNIINVIGHHHKILVVGNKLDLLPQDGPGMIARVTQSFRQNMSKLRPGHKNLFIQDVMVLSARTGFGVEALVTRLLSLAKNVPKDIFLIGASNSGKSTLFNALLQSDLSAVREGDLIARVSEASWLPGKMLKFPINLAEGWEVELKKKRLERVERNVKVYERSLETTTLNRQATSPHMSMLIDRLRIDDNQFSLVRVDGGEEERTAQFAANHPLADRPKSEHLSATRDKFIHHGFFHSSPSASTSDQLHDLLTIEERLHVFPHETIVPRKYSLRPLQSIFISGLARLDLLTATSNVIITIFASKYLPIHVIPTRRADDFYYTFLGTPYLGVPFGDAQRLNCWPKLTNSQPDFHIRGVDWKRGACDIVLSSVGWSLLNLCKDQECMVRAHTPEGRGISKRVPPLLPYGRNVKGEKIRDTPVFRHPQYAIQRSTT